MIWRWLPWLFVVAAAGIGGMGAFMHFRPVPAAGFEVDRPIRDLGDYPVGESTIAISVTNRSNEPRRVLGLSAGCGPNICIKAKHEGQILVQPNQTVVCECLIQVFKPESFEVSVPLHLEEDRGTRTETLTVRGVGFAPNKSKSPIK